MATINLAYTGAINPPSTSPVLTQSQVWTALERKVRRGQDFVPVIEATTVVSETKSTSESHPNLAPGTEVILREVKFTSGNGPAAAQMNNGLVTETCILLAPNRVDFLQADGSTVANIISQGPEGDHDLKMTYTFSWRHAALDPVSDKVAVDHMRTKYQEQAKMAVEKSIEAIRRMMREGDVGVYEVVRK